MISAIESGPDATLQAEQEWARVNAKWMTTLSPDNVFDWYEAVQEGHATIQLENRRPAKVLCVGTDGNRLVLTGNGAYPRA